MQKQHIIGAGLGAALATIVGLAACWFRLGEGLVHASYDLLFPFRAELKLEEIVIVSLDDASHRVLKQPENQAWDRSLHARLLERLTQEKAKLVVFDILFEDAGEGLADEALARAIKANGRVVLAANFTQGPTHTSLDTAQVVLPAERFREAAAGYGVDALALDADFAVRQMHPGESRIHSLAWVAAELAGALATKEAGDRFSSRWLNHYARPGGLPRISYYQALSKDVVEPGFFRDKYVFVGAQLAAGFTGASKESFATPYTFWTGRFAPGVEVQATMFLNLVRGDWLVRWPWWAESLLLAAIGAAAGAGLAWLRPLAASGVALAGAMAVSVTALWVAWRWHTWFSWVIAVAVQVPAAWAWAVTFHSMVSFHERRLLERLLSFHVSLPRARQLLRQPDLLKPGAEEIKISVLFSDIANFTSIVERMQPKELARLLNDYFEVSIQCVHREEGTVVKLIGDAVFAIWNAPVAQPNHQERVCRAALRLREALAEFDKKLKSLPLHTRIGLHTGPAHVGNFGSTQRFDYTAIGDSINLASRLEGLNKHLGTEILASRDALSEVEPLFVSRLMGHFRLKGFGRVVEVHELVGTRDKEEESRSWRTAFEEALRLYQRREFDGAEAGLKRTLELKSEDGPALFYLKLIGAHRKNPPGANWVGEVDLQEV